MMNSKETVKTEKKAGKQASKQASKQEPPVGWVRKTRLLSIEATLLARRPDPRTRRALPGSLFSSRTLPTVSAGGEFSLVFSVVAVRSLLHPYRPS